MSENDDKNEPEFDKNNEDTISPAEMYRILWEGRNTEISNLWQRSILLGTFLVLLWTASGWLFVRYLDLFQSRNIISNRLYLRELSIGAFVLSSLGAVMSILWIYMTKASKAWMEYSEGQINKAQKKFKEYLFSSCFPKGFPKHGTTWRKYIRNCKWNKCIFSTKGGPFSPSKINIMVGIVSLFYFIFYWGWVCFLFYNLRLGCCFPIINILVVLLLLCFIDRKVGSSLLDELKSN